MSRYWRFTDPQAITFTMKLMIILRFGLILLVVFYDDFPFPYWKEIYLYSYICLGDPLFKALRPPLGEVGKPWSIHTSFIHECITPLFLSTYPPSITFPRHIPKHLQHCRHEIFCKCHQNLPPITFGAFQTCIFELKDQILIYRP